MPQAEVRRQRMANKSARRVQALEAFLDFLLATCNLDEDAGHLAIGGQHNFVHRHQADARVFQFTLDQRGDFFPKRLAAACSKMFLCPVLHLSCFTRQKMVNVRGYANVSSWR